MEGGFGGEIKLKNMVVSGNLRLRDVFFVSLLIICIHSCICYFYNCYNVYC